MIVLSVIWAISAAIYTHRADVKGAAAYVNRMYQMCVETKGLNHDSDLSSCDAERVKNRVIFLGNSNANAAAVSLLPIPFAWLVAFILLYVGRAQLIGFRAVVPWRVLSTFKKLFVVFCALFSVGVIFAGTIAVMNLYVDTKVPVALSPMFDVIKTGPYLVTVHGGTWKRTDLIDDTIMNPLQTSDISCNKLENRCVEAQAYVMTAGTGTAGLGAEVSSYDIQSWTADAIAFRKDSECATELFTIDLNTKTVTGAGHPILGDYPWCKAVKPEWRYQLASGFDVYWGMRKKARPLLLRVFQAIFGD
jgi:hypothetical protein